MKWIIYIIFGLCILPLISAYFSYTGDLNTQFNVTTGCYNASIDDGVIVSLSDSCRGMNSTTPWWGYSEDGTSYGSFGLGVLYSGSYRMNGIITETTCSNVSNVVTCSNINATNIWYFNDTFIGLDSTVKMGAYRVYDACAETTSLLMISITNGSVMNSDMTTGPTDWDSTTGTASCNHSVVSNTTFLAMTWNTSITTDFDYNTNSTASMQGAIIARSSEIGTNITLRQYFKILSINTTNNVTAISPITQPLNAFKNDLLYGDAVTGGSGEVLCTWGGSGTFRIANTACNVTTAYNMLGNQVIISNATVKINASLTNYSILWIGNSSSYRRG